MEVRLLQHHTIAAAQVLNQDLQGGSSPPIIVISTKNQDLGCESAQFRDGISPISHLRLNDDSLSSLRKIGPKPAKDLN